MGPNGDDGTRLSGMRNGCAGALASIQRTASRARGFENGIPARRPPAATPQRSDQFYGASRKAQRTAPVTVLPNEKFVG